MKKWLIAIVLILAVALIVGCVVLCVHLLNHSDSTAEEASASAAQIEAYVREHWAMFDVSYEEATQSLTLNKSASMTFEKACAYGASVYSGELAPDSYLSEIRSIGLDVLASFDCPSLSVELLYMSSDGEPIFSVKSDGTVWTCWE